MYGGTSGISYNVVTMRGTLNATPVVSVTSRATAAPIATSVSFQTAQTGTSSMPPSASSMTPPAFPPSRVPAPQSDLLAGQRYRFPSTTIASASSPSLIPNRRPALVRFPKGPPLYMYTQSPTNTQGLNPNCNPGVIRHLGSHQSNHGNCWKCAEGNCQKDLL